MQNCLVPRQAYPALADHRMFGLVTIFLQGWAGLFPYCNHPVHDRYCQLSTRSE
jgi:hypothetical protein